MDRPELLDRLPGERLRQRLPSVWSPGEEDDDEQAAEDGEWKADPVDPEGEETDDVGPDEDDESTGKLRTVLLGLSVFGAALAVGAAVVRRALGRNGGDDESDEEEKTAVGTGDADGENDEPVSRPVDEGTAALIGLAFLAAVEALRDRLASPTE